MTRAEENRLFWSHMRRDLELTTDPQLMRIVLAAHARRNGRTWRHLA